MIKTSWGYIYIVAGNVPGLLQGERAAARRSYFPHKRHGSDGIDVVFDEKQTHTTNEGIQFFIGVLREVKHRFIHVFLSGGAGGRRSRVQVLVHFLHHAGEELRQ